MKMRAVSYIEDANPYLRDLIFPEEDRHLFTTAPWHGGYRWFRSPNVVPIEQWRQDRLLMASPADKTAKIQRGPPS